MENLAIIKSKIFSREDFQPKRHLWRFRKQKVVFTNGCFDLLHLGHIHFLAQAADLGDRLVIGLNTDGSVQRIKGANRPVKDEETRATILAALHFVDAVLMFDEDTPDSLIRFVEPDVLVKGADYDEKDIVGADFVQNHGGEIKTLELLPGHSSSAMIDTVRSE